MIHRAIEAGVGPIVAVGEDLSSSRQAVSIAGQYPHVFAAVGVHPHRADRFDEEQEEVRALLNEAKVVAVGEIGLDYYRGTAPRSSQLAAFRTQLGWAREAGMPASIHNRDADDDLLVEIRPSDRAILHCFSGGWSLAQAALDLGCSVSFAGNVTFPKAQDLRDVARQVPTERLLIESDAPVLAPQPRRGRRNEPAYVTMTAETLADVRSVSLSALENQISENARKLFGWSAM